MATSIFINRNFATFLVIFLSIYFFYALPFQLSDPSITHRLHYFPNLRSNKSIYKQGLQLFGKKIEKYPIYYSQNKDLQQNIFKNAIATLLLTFSVTVMMTSPSPVFAADTVAVGKCLLRSCQKELLQCVLNPKCLANVICLNSCNGRADESECEIHCGDQFENEQVGVFNNCAVSQKRCVPQKQDTGEYPLPLPSSTVKSLNTKDLDGRWYISAGLNPAFDTFDCQVHFFTSPRPGLFFAKLFWRVTEPDGEFFTKDAVQRFVQDEKDPGHLLNHNNEYLHYKDDWYVLDIDPKEFMLVYYRGSNDAWDGYGGGVLYTRDGKAPRAEIIPRLIKAIERANIPYKWSDFKVNDNSCLPQTESATVLREKFASRLLITEEQQLQEQLTAARNAAINTFREEEEEATNAIISLEGELSNFLKQAVGQ